MFHTDFEIDMERVLREFDATGVVVWGGVLLWAADHRAVRVPSSLHGAS